MFEAVYCNSQINYWLDSDCYCHWVTGHNLVRFYSDGVVIARFVELNERMQSPGFSPDTLQPDPLPADFRDAIVQRIDRNDEQTYSLKGTYSTDGNSLTMHLDRVHDNDLRVDRTDAKYWGSDSAVPLAPSPHVYNGKLVADSIRCADGMVLTKVSSW